jgi:catechol 2,3-dioxygenase-like lactoylglutathione lyase family enzyme
MLKDVMYVTVYVTDQDRALEFYVGGLGLQKRIDYPGPDGRFLTVAAADSPVEIVLWSHAPAAGQPAEAAPGATPGPIILESDDLHRDFAECRGRGVPFVQPEPEDYPFGIRAEAVDPDGNLVSLRERPRRQ